MSTDYAKFLCSCGKTTISKLDKWEMTCTNQDCKIVDLLDAYIEYTCFKCKKTKQCRGDPLHYYVISVGNSILPYPNRKDPDYDVKRKQWEENYRKFRDRFEGGDDGCFEATTQIVDKDYHFMFAPKEVTTDYNCYQVWVASLASMSGDAYSNVKYPAGTVVCHDCREGVIDGYYCH